MFLLWNTNGGPLIEIGLFSRMNKGEGTVMKKIVFMSVGIVSVSHSN